MPESNEDRLKNLETAVGLPLVPYNRQSPKPPELINGEYPVFYRQKMLNYSVDDLWAAVQSMQDRLDMQDEKIRLLEARPTGTVNTPPPQPADIGGTWTDGLLWFKSPNGVGIAFESDTNFGNGQRAPGNGWRQTFTVVLSDDGGGGMHQNVVWPEDGGRAYIPDPTRYGVSYRLDRQGMLSINLYRAGGEFAPGKFAVLETARDGTTIRKGQLAVVIPDENGDLTVRLPQGGKLLLEKGNGNADRTNGHKAAISRQEVTLGADVGSPATGGLPGGGGT